MSLDLAKILEADADCDYCQRKIKNHNYIEALACLQELSKSHKEFRENYVQDIIKVEEALKKKA